MRLRNDVGCIAEIQDALWWPDAEVLTGASLHFTSIEKKYAKMVLPEPSIVCGVFDCHLSYAYTAIYQLYI